MWSEYRLCYVNSSKEKLVQIMAGYVRLDQVIQVSFGYVSSGQVCQVMSGYVRYWQVISC